MKVRQDHVPHDKQPLQDRQGPHEVYAEPSDHVSQDDKLLFIKEIPVWNLLPARETFPVAQEVKVSKVVPVVQALGQAQPEDHCPSALLFRQQQVAYGEQQLRQHELDVREKEIDSRMKDQSIIKTMAEGQLELLKSLMSNNKKLL